uniref:(northern house mosquito) hypothetical protein n=1 Tax=Culex pipiens TaxID=7175 RepID=A0A8D8NK79_CULPI
MVTADGDFRIVVAVAIRTLRLVTGGSPRPVSKITPKLSTRSRSLAKICFVHCEEAGIGSQNLAVPASSTLSRRKPCGHTQVARRQRASTRLRQQRRVPGGPTPANDYVGNQPN